MAPDEALTTDAQLAAWPEHSLPQTAHLSPDMLPKNRWRSFTIVDLGSPSPRVFILWPSHSLDALCLSSRTSHSLSVLLAVCSEAWKDH